MAATHESESKSESESESRFHMVAREGHNSSTDHEELLEAELESKSESESEPGSRFHIMAVDDHNNNPTTNHDEEELKADLESKSEPEQESESRFHILAVDDSLVDRKLIERLLKTCSYQVTAVDSVNKALEFLGLLEDSMTTTLNPENHEVEVNLIITDYWMPEMTGYDLLRKIKECRRPPWLKEIPVVIMSSENEESTVNACLERGALHFIHKPVRHSDVVTKLKPHFFIRSQQQQQQCCASATNSIADVGFRSSNTI